MRLVYSHDGRKTTKGRLNYDKYGYFFVAPFILIFLIFQLYPIAYTINLSFTDLKGWETEYNYVIFKNFKNLLHNKIFLKSIMNTLIIWTMNFIPQLLVALFLAERFTNTVVKIRGKGLYKVLFYLPGIITAASVSVLFFSLFGYPVGPINSILESLKLIDSPFEFFRSKIATRSIVAFIQFWMFYGSTMIMIISAIMGIDTSIFEAGMIDGTNSRKAFRYITLPLIKPVMLYILVTSLIGGLQIFDIPYLLTGGAPDNSVGTVTMYIYNQAFTGGRNFGIAAAAAVILLLIIMVLSACLFRFFRDEK